MGGPRGPTCAGEQLPMWSPQTRRLIEIACDEDLGQAGDLTSALLPGASTEVAARVVPRQPGVICGLEVGPAVCQVFSQRLNQPLRFVAARADGREYRDGDTVEPGTCVATLSGPQAAVLATERTLLNFLGRMSGVATLTRRFVAVARQVNPRVSILDTRKTIPGWRELDKYAVRTGGGQNHRLGLYDAVLIKDNHLASVPIDRLAATLTDFLTRLTRSPSFVEVEADSLEQLAEVCQVPGVNVVLLDNFSLEQMRAATEYRDAQGLRGKLALEASGGVTLENVGGIAATGVDRISIGGLTHAAPSLDIGLDL
jgi:nicotinate-nucleotide pyrophosphorylase (carboxylating)